jgi:FkbM family methyltransferase
MSIFDVTGFTMDIKNRIREFIFKRYNVSFSKSGDDIQLMKLLKHSTPGTYVDIGSWHPKSASNTYFFYLRKWRGICIDPNPELQKLYSKFRPGDTFLTCGVGHAPGELNYYMLDDHNSSMNTFDLDFIRQRGLEPNIKKTISVPVRPLSAILEEHLRPNERLDFFDIDVEGLDFEVLQSNDWERFRPKIIAIETNLPLNEDIASRTVLYLEAQGYSLSAKTVIFGNLGNLFLIDTRLPCE